MLLAAYLLFFLATLVSSSVWTPLASEQKVGWAFPRDIVLALLRELRFRATPPSFSFSFLFSRSWAISRGDLLNSLLRMSIVTTPVLMLLCC